MIKTSDGTIPPQASLDFNLPVRHDLTRIVRQIVQDSPVATDATGYLIEKAEYRSASPFVSARSCGAFQGAERPTMLWLECGSCSGESMAILGAEGPGKEGYNLLDFLEHNQVELLWHPSLSSESPTQLATLVQRILADEQELTFLCVEGSIIHGPQGTGMFDTFEGKPKKDIIRALCDKADFVMAMGTCSSYGGIPAAPPNPTESSGLQFTNEQPGGLLDPEWRSRTGLPVLNLAGCPVDAATMIKTMSWVLKGLPLELDVRNRPFTVGPCLSDALRQKCGTSEKVGYSCYGCISAKFPINRGMFRHMEHTEKEKPFDRTSEHTFMNYSRQVSGVGVQSCG